MDDKTIEAVESMESMLQQMGATESRINHYVKKIEQLDCLIPCQIDGVDDVATHVEKSKIMFEVEAMVVTNASCERTQYRLPTELRSLLDGEMVYITEAACNPDGNGWGAPTYGITVEVV